MASPSSSKVWFITGCSTGFGRELAIAARKRGDFVIATARKLETLCDLKQLGCATLALDVTTSEDDVKSVVDQAHVIYGRIDFLVNNAGITVMGAVEEATDKDVSWLFETNLYGHLRVTRAVLPYMRQAKSGTIAFMGSGLGYVPFPVNGVYGATKFAIAGISQSLAQEVEHLGIEVTVVEPGVFRTKTLSHNYGFSNDIEDYRPLKKAIFDSMANGVGGIPPQDPAKGAQAVVEALTKTGRGAGRSLPRRLPLGGEMMPVMEAELAIRKKEMNEWAVFTEPNAFAFDPEGRSTMALAAEDLLITASLV